LELSDNQFPAETAPPAAPAITTAMVAHMRQTKPWVRFLSILGFIVTGMMMLMGLFVMFGGGLLAAITDSALGGLEAVALGFFYLIISVIYIFPALYLFRFADGIKKMINVDQVAGMEEALRYQKSFWRFAGIMALVAIVIQILLIGLILVLALLGLLGASSGRL